MASFWFTSGKFNDLKSSLLNRFFSLLILSATLLIAAEVKAQVSTQVEEINGEVFYLHTVSKGQTLYAISKLYQCDINAITGSNPGADAGIRDGQIIRIPASKSKVKGQSVSLKEERKYLMHEVQKKETLYSISNKYGIDINDLIAANPGSDAGVKKGQMLKIPVKQEKPKVIPADKRTHTVQQGETLFGIAKQYSVTTDDILQANDGLKRGLLAGEDIFIPGNIGPKTPSGNATSAIHDIDIPEPHVEDVYDIAIMLPFYTHYKDTMESRENKMRDVALQIYRGAMLASDSLSAMGLHARVHVYDVLDEKNDIKQVLSKKEMAETDLIIGPLFRDVMSDVCNWGNLNGAHVVVPVQQPNKVLLNSPNMSKSVPAEATQWLGIARHIYKKYPKENIILIDSKNIDDRKSVDVFRDEWKKLSGDTSVRTIVVGDAASFSVKDKYLTGKKNIVIAPTNDKKVIATLFRVLGEGDIVVYGPEGWSDSEAISIANRNKYKVHFPQTTFIDYSNEHVQQWVELYRKKYKSEPGKFSFIGYDIMMHYGSGLKTFGRAFPNHMNEIKSNPLAMGYDFLKTSNESGFENQFVIIVGTENYELIREN